MKDIVAVLYNIRSVHNVGSMFRTADAAGVSKIYLCGITPTPLDRFDNPRKDFVKVSLGAEKSVPWVRRASFAKCLAELRRQGYVIYAVEQHKKSVPYFRLKKKNQSKIALIFGNEVRGLPQSFLKQADTILEIPMRGRKESLNVSVAFGIVVYGIQY